jgi:type VI secretion system secreted protein Hcp
MKKKHKLVFGPLAVGLCALPADKAMAAFDAFLKIDGVPGESQDSKHRDEIDIVAFTQAVAAPGTNAPTFSFSMRQNRSSPLLYAYCAGGSNVTSMVFTLRSEGATMIEFLKCTLSDATITSIHTAGATTGLDPAPTDDFMVTFRKIEWLYRYQTSTGSITTITTTWTSPP